MENLLEKNSTGKQNGNIAIFITTRNYTPRLLLQKLPGDFVITDAYLERWKNGTVTMNCVTQAATCLPPIAPLSAF